ncbi:hypothetical protein [Actinomadura sp. 3N407]|uniref:hypothetical protein n=1 Tax=Actinomadura sp. 3N407 TaxID=3457423 RepID=UPI003FCDA9C5
MARTRREAAENPQHHFLSMETHISNALHNVEGDAEDQRKAEIFAQLAIAHALGAVAAAVQDLAER